MRLLVCTKLVSGGSSMMVLLLIMIHFKDSFLTMTTGGVLYSKMFDLLIRIATLSTDIFADLHLY